MSDDIIAPNDLANLKTNPLRRVFYCAFRSLAASRGRFGAGAEGHSVLEFRSLKSARDGDRHR